MNIQILISANDLIGRLHGSASILVVGFRISKDMNFVHILWRVWINKGVIKCMINRHSLLRIIKQALAQEIKTATTQVYICWNSDNA